MTEHNSVANRVVVALARQYFLTKFARMMNRYEANVS